MPLVHYAGFRSDGSAWSGAEYGTPAQVAASLYDDGWISARLSVDGAVVGEVSTLPGSQKRSWWADT